MSDKRLIFFDIDGTLINEKNIIPQSTRDSINRLKASGHEVAIATGRSPFMFKELREELQIDTYVSFNGQYVVAKGKPIYEHPLNNEKLTLLVHEAKHNNNPLIYVGLSEMRSNVVEHSLITDSLNSLHLCPPKYDPNYLNKKKIFQVMLFCKEKEEIIYERSFPNFKITRWHPFSVDIDPVHGTKDKGVEKIKSVLEYTANQLVVFGDDLNDIEMISSAQNGIAMGNAHPKVKDAAKFTTKSVNEDGILYGLQRLGLLS